jgi:cell division protein ZapE|tara:strand:+ start:105 stop:1142 length:1038 start_codon:yes stop_codon:yes gene_type:complete
MLKNTLQDSFLEFCKKKKFENNNQQIEIINLLDSFINPKKTVLNYFFNYNKKLCFYLYGGVGVGKTMIFNFIYDKLKIKKLRLHFNEFMINFHDFRHEREDYNSIRAFVKNLKKKYDLIYLDEFQVTNIVDAMILGKLFEVVFLENIKIIITTNIKLNDLYKDGLQREQFLPFIRIIKKYSIQKELSLKDDYRQTNEGKFKRIFYPLNEKISFKLNQSFRELTRDKKKEEKIILTKGRNFKIDNFFSGISRFKFNDLCDVNLGAEDYINIAEVCKHIFIEEVPIFNDENSNQQLRFITLIDIFYEKKIALTLSLANNISNLNSSKKHSETFKRTLSRLYEMTNYN